MKTVFESVAVLLETANTALGEIEWHKPKEGFSQVVQAMLDSKLARTQGLIDSLKEKASK